MILSKSRQGFVLRFAVLKKNLQDIKNRDQHLPEHEIWKNVNSFGEHKSGATGYRNQGRLLLAIIRKTPPKA